MSLTNKQTSIWNIVVLIYISCIFQTSNSEVISCVKVIWDKVVLCKCRFIFFSLLLTLVHIIDSRHRYVYKHNYLLSAYSRILRNIKCLRCKHNIQNSIYFIHSHFIKHLNNTKDAFVLYFNIQNNKCTPIYNKCQCQHFMSSYAPIIITCAEI